MSYYNGKKVLSVVQTQPVVAVTQFDAISGVTHVGDAGLQTTTSTTINLLEGCELDDNDFITLFFDTNTDSYNGRYQTQCISFVYHKTFVELVQASQTYDGGYKNNIKVASTGLLSTLKIIFTAGDPTTYSSAPAGIRTVYLKSVKVVRGLIQ